MTTLIESALPEDWRDLQDSVARIFRECGLAAETNKKIDTIRGPVNIDVFAEDAEQTPPAVYLCECKHWKSKVPKTVVHAFRSVVSDYGANWGLIISSAGFQRGAPGAAKGTNLRLLNWWEFQELFVDRWYSHYVPQRLREEADPLVEYTEPINSRIFRKADALPQEKRERFIALREQYIYLAYLALPMYMQREFKIVRPDVNPMIELPLERKYIPLMIEFNLPQDLLEAIALRDFIEIYIRHVRKALAEFDDVFGERA